MRNLLSLRLDAREMTSAASVAPSSGAMTIGDRLAPADGESFRVAMRQLAGGVCLIAHGVGVERVGQTATSVTSLSVDPPSLIVCVSRGTSSYPGLAPGIAFGVNVLGAHQQEFADRFFDGAGISGAERFDYGHWIVSPSGAPLLSDSLAAFDCEVDDIIERHAHAIIIGRVKGVAIRKQGGALVFWRGVYDSLGWDDDELSRAVGVTPRAL